TYLPRWASPSLRRRDPSPPWQVPFALAFTGVRGVVSLAAALAIPLTDTHGAPFPQRDLTLFITFAVILITLVGQGVLLSSVMRRLGLLRGAAEERRLEWQAEHDGRSAALSAMRRHLDWLATQRKLSDQVVADLKARHEQRVHQLPTDMEKGLERIREA